MIKNLLIIFKNIMILILSKSQMLPKSTGGLSFIDKPLILGYK
ncbi:hypothetical protein LCGC14_1902800 [marine sediment metagenome]|uniref:Uncharacterized protein n=1 Tax=marine sediment metagenome TaxID=412755 RepID=A0A0F9I9Z0_9ZZZZ